MEDISHIYLALISLTGVAMGWINAIAGGGSLLSLPLLMLLGLPADIANGTNRVAVITQGISGVHGFSRAGKLDTSRLVSLLIPTAIGAVVGSLLAVWMPREVLKPIMLGTMVLVATVIVIRGGPSNVDEATTYSPRERPLAYLGMFFAGIYGGFIQAGVGYVLLAVLVGTLRYDLVRANALKMVCALGFAIIAVPIFAFADKIAWVPALALALGTGIGAQLGVHTQLRLSPQVLRWFIFSCVVISSIAILVRSA